MIRIIESIGSDEDKKSLCECDACGTTFIHDKNRKDCPVCNNHTYDMDDLTKDEKTYAHMLTSKYTELCSMGPDTSRQSAYWDVIDQYGVYENTEHYWRRRPVVKKHILKCKRCGMIKITSEYNINKVVCNKCRFVLADTTRTRSLNDWNDIKSSTERELKRKENADAQLADAQKNFSIQVGKSDRLSVIKKALKKYNPTLEAIEIATENGVDTTYCKCTICGALNTIPTQSVVILKKYKCKGCEISKSDPNYLGYFKRNLDGTIKNHMVVTSTDAETVNVYCRMCGKRRKAVSKIRYFRGSVICNCEYSTTGLDCPFCGGFTQIPIKDIVELGPNQSLPCTLCNKELPSYLLRGAIAQEDKAAEIRLLLKQFGTNVKSDYDIVGDIAKVREVLYCDSNGNMYHNCRCLQHKQNLILNDNEILDYNHKMCNKKHSLFISKEAISNVTISKKEGDKG